MQDFEIVELFFNRDSSSIDESHRKYGQNMWHTAFNILSNNEDSEEVVSDALFAAWNRIPPDSPHSLCAYLISITRNISISLLRKRYADKRGNGDYALALDELEGVVSSSHTPDEELDAREIAMAINRFLSSLKSADRIIFVRRYWLMEPVKQIAHNLGIGESRVKSSLSRSRKTLAKKLRTEGYI